MNVDQLTMLLTRIQVLDNRQVDEITIEAWLPLMADVPYLTAVDAVNEHFRTSSAYLLPSHIRSYAKRALLPIATMSPEAPTECPNGAHRRVADGTCMYCTDRPSDG